METTTHCPSRTILPLPLHKKKKKKGQKTRGKKKRKRMLNKKNIECGVETKCPVQIVFIFSFKLVGEDTD